MDLRFAFLNCQNHFTIRARHSRGSADAAAYTQKVDGLASVLSECFRPDPPDLFGLCEVGSMTAAKDILDAIRPARSYDLVWQKPPARRPKGWEAKTGLCVCFDPAVLAVEDTLRSEMTVRAARYHWFAVRMRVRSNNREFWFVVNHWPSDLNYGSVRGTWPRAQLGAALGELVARTIGDADGILLVGDFNCEPFDPPMTGSVTAWPDRLIATRERAHALSTTKHLPYLYNLMWRHVGELNPYDQAAPTDRPPGTYRAGDAWRCLDQILVDRALMLGPALQLRESSVVIRVPDQGGTDQCAIGGVLEYT